MIERALPTKSGYLELPEENVKIYWDYFGYGEKEVCVFFNGLGMMTESWYTSVPRVHPEFDVLLFDYRGQGKSTRDDVPYYIPKFCEYLVKIMDQLNIEKVHSQGVSYGGFVAADFGRLYPDRIYTQTLSGILLTQELSFQPVYQEISLTFYRNGLGDRGYFDLYTRYLYEKIFSEKFLRQIFPKIERMRMKFYNNYQESIQSLIRLTEAQNPFFEQIAKNGTEGYQKVKAPTLILAGEHDRAIPLWMQEKLLDVYPNSKMYILPGCGHLTYFEEPEIFWENFKALARTKSLDYELEVNRGLEVVLPGQKAKTVAVAK
ncbi:MAG: alpha/beta fold hydrolase [Desulfotomaculales bacterium]